MKRICAWCNSPLEPANSLGAGHQTSHGACPDCAHHLFAQLGMPLDEYLNGLRAPVLVMNGNAAVLAANQQAQAVLGKKPTDMEGRLGGDVFECAHAKSPAGCGRTVHCNGCVIRHAVTDTFATGRPHVRVPGALPRQPFDVAERTDVVISTEKVNGIVVLRIDSMAVADRSAAVEKKLDSLVQLTVA